MGRFRGWIRRLERESRGELIVIPLKDGGVAKFRPKDLEEAFEAGYRQLCGEDVELYPLNLAAQSSSDAQWRQSAFFGVHVLDGGGDIRDVEDMSEGA